MSLRTRVKSEFVYNIFSYWKNNAPGLPFKYLNASFMKVDIGNEASFENKFNTWAHTHRSKKDGSLSAHKELFTYVFSEQHGKWVWVSGQHSEAPTDVAVEEAAIKSVVEKETQAFLDRDAEAMADCHANVDYATLLVRHGGGVAFTKNTKKEGPQVIKTTIASLGKSDGSTFKNTDYVIHIKDKTAFVTFDQTMTALNGAKSFFHEVRYMEKINLKWLIVYVGAVVFDPGH